jgi:hypothetical protein
MLEKASVRIRSTGARMAEYWRGEDYGDEENILGGARLFVLGEAHYHADAPIGTDMPEITQGVVESYIAGRMGANAMFFRRIERLVCRRLSRGLTQEESRDFWHSVVFSNYIPVIAGNGPGERPPAPLWEGRAPAEFAANVQKTEAEMVLICGTELWRRKPFNHAVPEAYRVGERGYEGHEIRWSENYFAIAAHIPHPSGSRGWSYERCLPVVEYLFRHMNERRRLLDIPVAVPSTWHKADAIV